MWVEIDLGNTTQEICISLAIKHLLAQRVERFRKAEIKIHC